MIETTLRITAALEGSCLWVFRFFSEIKDWKSSVNGKNKPDWMAY